MNDTEKFMSAQEHYLQHHDKASWDVMFLCVYKACGVALKKYIQSNNLPHLYKDEFHYRQIDATNAIMTRYLKPKGYKIKYIATVARNSAFDIMTRRKTRETEELEKVTVHCVKF